MSLPKMRILTLTMTPAIWLLAGCSLGVSQTVEPPPDMPEVATEIARPTPPAVATAVPEPAVSPLVDPAAWPPPVAGTIRVDASVHSGPISPYLYGSNTGPWSTVPLDLLDEAVAARITALRFPGGEYADRNAVTHDQIDRFISLARDLGAEPTIHVRLREGTPEAAAEMVRYTNIEKGYGVKYWAIGNEPNLYPPDDVYTPEKVSADWRALAKAMKEVDPGILLMGPEITGYLAPPASDDFTIEAREMTEVFLRENADLVDIVTIHRYPFPASQTSPPPTLDELADDGPRWDAMIADLRRLVIDTTGRDLPIGITEFNSNWSKQSGAETTPDSVGSAVWLADVLGRFAVNRVFLGNQFALQTGPVIGVFGLLERTSVRPSYYVYPLMARFGSELVYASVGDDEGGVHPRVTAYAATRPADGALTLWVINRGAEPAEFVLSLAGHPGGAADAYRLDAGRVEAGTVTTPVETVAIEDGMTISAPPLSATLYVIP